MGKKKKKKADAYDWSQFTLRIAISASPEKVFKAWTHGPTIAKWFSVKAKMEPKKGGKVSFEWLGGDKMDDTVIAVTKNRKLVIPFGHKGEKVEVTIKKDGRGSICELHQYDMKTSKKDKIHMHMGCKTGWVFFLTNLKSVLEKRIDLRSHDPKRSYTQHFVNS